MKIVCQVASAAAVLLGAAAVHAAALLPAPTQLAPLAFPGWSASGPGRLHTVQVPFGTAERHGWRTGPARVLVDPKLVLRGDDGRLVLVAGLVPVGADGRADVAQDTPMALAAYQFEAEGKAWRLSLNQGIFAWRGFGANATLRAVALGGARHGLGVEYGSCWDGYCGTWLALYELDRGGMRREPAVELALSGANADGAADCAQRLQSAPGTQPAPPQQPSTSTLTSTLTSTSAPPAMPHDCYAIEGSWSVEAAQDRPGDLVVHYRGAISRDEARLAPPLAIDQRQVLRYGGGKYRAVSGFNPVPSL